MVLLRSGKQSSGARRAAKLQGEGSDQVILQSQRVGICRDPKPNPTRSSDDNQIIEFSSAPHDSAIAGTSPADNPNSQAQERLPQRSSAKKGKPDTRESEPHGSDRKNNSNKKGKSAKDKQEHAQHRNEDRDDTEMHFDVPSDSKKRSRKELEIEWDRSQLRDSRPTPERVVPPRRSEFDLTEEEKQYFKGPPPKRPKKKGRLNAFDKNEMFKEEARDNVSHCFHELHVCYDKGPKGSPTYDEAGFQLDYGKVADWMKPRAYNKSSMISGMDKAVKEQKDADSRMAAAFFEGGKLPEDDDGRYTIDLLKDKVSKDLGVAWHKISPAKVEDWANKGFTKENPRDYVRSTVTKEEQKRFSSLQGGCVLRK